MWLSQIWFSKEPLNITEATVMEENNCLNPEYVGDIKTFEPSELHNWNKPKILEIKGGTVRGVEVAPGWKHFKSYELDMLVHELPGRIKYEVWNEDECLEEGTLGEKDLEFKNIDWWVRSIFLDNYEPFNECDELLKKKYDFCVDDEIYDLINKYKEDSSTWSGKEALFDAGCLAKRKLCDSAVFYDVDEWEVADCPEDIEELHFNYITLHL